MKGKSVTSRVGLMKYGSSFYIAIIIAIAISAPQLLPAARAQMPTANNNATLDPAEARILNSIFQQWGIQANNQQWNLSGELCTGAAVDSTSMQDTAYNPGIKCDCSSTPCHITALKVYALDVAGAIPDELWNLTYISDLNLGQNYLTGTLSPAIGNLRRMQYLSLGLNALSGKLPKELGLLTELISLSISMNSFSGPLHSELGNLKTLTQLYIDSSGVSGVIPPTFANLLNLEILWASDTELSGRIPDFIGNWSKLTTLRLQGIPFQGPIPPTLSNLTSMVDLRISDLLTGSSSLDFIRNMKNLSILVLRNNNISGSIPSNIEEYQSLLLLDLSFNNLTGRVPDQLFNLPSLQNLFLGSNKLTGSLPAHKSQNLQIIDLSYNEISGNFPSWTGGQGLQLNLISNNFTIDSSNGSGLPSGLNCLQKNFQCNRGTPVYSSFAIKCGGQQITSSNGIVYERDNETLGPATYYMTTTGRWAVSNVGLPSDSNRPQYIIPSPSDFTNTLDSRLSSGSLRYYGLRLLNGHYTVTLQFSESVILNYNPPSWKSIGRRIFNIYIQGNLMEKDFNIQEESGQSLVAISRKYKVQVSENYMEIHLFWAGKGTCCVPRQGTYGPLISAISATPDFDPPLTPVSDKPPSEESEQKKNRTGMVVGIVVAVGGLSFLSVFAVYCFVQRRKRQDTYDDEGTNE